MNVDSAPRALAVAAILALGCSAMVATAVYSLRPIQHAFAQVERNRAILAAAGQLPADDVSGRRPADDVSDRTVIDLFLDLDAQVVELTAGRFLPQGERPTDPHAFDHWSQTAIAAKSQTAPPASDNLSQGQQPDFAPVYLVKRGDHLARLVLPVHGPGMWSTIYGYVALEDDLTTVADIVIFRHGETPGVGDRILDPAWRASWRGKRIYNSKNEAQVRVVKGATGPHEIDIISGASVTSAAVGDIVRHWFGDDGYRILLRRMHSTEQGQ